MVDEMDIVTFMTKTGRSSEKGKHGKRSFNQSCTQSKPERRHSSEPCSHQAEDNQHSVELGWMVVNRRKQKHKYKLKPLKH